MCLHIFLVSIVFSLALLLLRTAMPAEIREILLLLSYDNRDDWLASILDGVQEVLAVSPKHIHAEYLDARNIPDRKILDHFGRYIFTKYAAIPFEAVIVANNAALDFILDNRSFFHPDLCR